jgi:hypothetical protein
LLPKADRRWNIYLTLSSVACTYTSTALPLKTKKNIQGYTKYLQTSKTSQTSPYSRPPQGFKREGIGLCATMITETWRMEEMGGMEGWEVSRPAPDFLRLLAVKHYLKTLAALGTGWDGRIALLLSE